MKSQIVMAQTQGGNSFRQGLEDEEDRKDERAKTSGRAVYYLKERVNVAS